MTSSPILSGSLTSGVTVGANDAWAVGVNLLPNSSDSLAEHWNGTQWSLVSNPHPAAITQFSAVVALSANDIWAAGRTSNSSAPSAEYAPMLQHWDGTRWSLISSFQQGVFDQINAMVAASSQDIIVGSYRADLLRTAQRSLTHSKRAE